MMVLTKGARAKGTRRTTLRVTEVTGPVWPGARHKRAAGVRP